MERGSSKHGPVVDDLLKRETEQLLPDRGSARSAGHRDSWGTAEETPEQAGRLDQRPRGGGLSHREAEERAELAKYIPGACFPGDKARLMGGAREMDAPEPVLQKLTALAEEAVFDNVQQVWEALGGPRDING